MLSRLVDACTQANKATVMEQLTHVVAILAHGNAPNELAPFLGGAKLMASPKKSGGLRPIELLWERSSGD